MAVSGVRAQRFLQPAPGGASAVFARQRGMVASAPARLPAVEEKESRSGKASGRDYGNFFSKKRNVSAIQGAVNALKTLLVGTFIAAKSLGATLKGVVKQIKGMSGGGGGLFGTLGIIGLVGAVIAGVAAIFGPQIKKAFEWLKGGAEGLFQDVKGRLDAADKNLEKLYNTIKDFVNVTVTNIIGQVNSAIGSINNVIKAIEPIANFMSGFPELGPLGAIRNLGNALKGLPTLPDPMIPVDKLPKLPEYRDVLGDNGINFLKSYDSLGDLGGAMVSGAGSMLGGGIDSMTGFVGDLINNILASLGLTDAGNQASEYLGMGSLFGESRELGSGPGVSSLIPGGFEGIIPGIQSTLGLGGDGQRSPDGGFSGGANNYGMVQDAVTDTKWKPILNLIASAESINGSYSSAYHPNGSKIIPGLENMSIEDAVASSGGVDSNGRHYAIGRYQFTTLTTDQAARANLKVTDKFSPANQDKMAIALIEGKKGVTFDMLKNNPAKAQMRLAEEWAGLPKDTSNKSVYGNDGVNAAHRTTAEVQDAIGETLRGGIQTPPPPKPTTQPAPAQTQSSNTTVPKPVSKASTIVLPGGTQVAQAPQRPRPDTAVPNISGEGGNPTIAFYSPSFFDALDINPIGAFG